MTDDAACANYRAIARGLTFPADVVPLGLIVALIDGVGGDLGSLFIFDLLGDDEVENDGQERSKREAGLQDKLNRVEEAEQCVVVS